MSDNLKELDEVLAKASEHIGRGDDAGRLARSIIAIALEIRAALELKARVDAGVVEVIHGYHPDADHVVSIVCDCKETALRIEAALEENNAMLNAAPAAQENEDGQ